MHTVKKDDSTSTTGSRSEGRMTPERILRFEVASRELLEQMAAQPLPTGLDEIAADMQFFRVIHFDTVAGDLESKGASVRLHIDDQGKQTLLVDVSNDFTTDGDLVRRSAESEVTGIDPAVLFSGTTEPARIVRSLIDPRRLVAAIELEIVRRFRSATMPGSKEQVKFWGDAITLRQGEVTGELYELEVALPSTESPRFQGLVQEFEQKYGVRLTLAETITRARDLLRRLEIDRLEDTVKAGREVAVIAYNRGRIALCKKESVLLVPTGPGTGHEAVRRVLSEYFGRPYGRIRYLGTGQGTESHPTVEVWLAEDVAHIKNECIWTRLDDVLSMVGTTALRDARTLTALNAVARSNVVGRAALRSRMGATTEEEEEDPETSTLFEATITNAKERAAGSLDHIASKDIGSELLLNPEVSRLLFDERILSIVEDERTPLLERVKFLSMFWTRVDDFYMTRIAEFKDQVADGDKSITPDGLTPLEQLELTRLRARYVAQRAYDDLITQLLPALSANQIEIMRWRDLDKKDQKYLRDTYTARVEAVITPV